MELGMEGQTVPWHPYNFGFFSSRCGGFPCTPKHSLWEGALTPPCSWAEVSVLHAWLLAPQLYL